MGKFDVRQIADRIGVHCLSDGGKPDERPRGPQRHDGWQSLLTGRGTKRDRRTSYAWETEHVTSAEAYDLWQGNDLAARGIEIWPDEMFRAGWDLRLGGDDDDATKRAELVQELEQDAENLTTDDKLWHAVAYERAYGGGAAFLGANDGAGSLALPLLEERTQKLEFLLELEPEELQAATYYNAGPKLGRPETYWFQPFSRGGNVPVRELIHESRLLINRGIVVSRRQLTPLPGWGSSVLTRVNGVVRDYGLSWGAAALILQTFNVSVLKIKNLYQMFANNEDAAIENRMIALDMMRDILGIYLVDTEEGIEDQARNVTGMPDLLDRFGTRVSTAFDVPVTRLVGTSPAGMNATGEYDQKAWYDRVDAQRERKVRPHLEKVARLLMHARGQDPEQLSIEFRPLYQESDAERTATRKLQAEIDLMYLDAGVVTAIDIARGRFGGDQYSHDTQVDIKELEAEIEEEKKLAEARALLAPPPDPNAPPAPEGEEPEPAETEDEDE